MSIVIPVFGAITIVVTFVFLLLMKRSRYIRKAYLLTRTEAKSYKVFEEALMHNKTNCRLFAQVRIADVIDVVGKKKNGAWWKAFKKISSKHVDFVVTKANFEIVACIEVDDSSHSRKDRIARDKLVNEVFKNAELPLIRVAPNKEHEGIKKLLDLANPA